MLVSATIKGGEALKVLNLAESGKVSCVVSLETLGEFDKVIQGEEMLEKFGAASAGLKLAVLKMLAICQVVSPLQKLEVVKGNDGDNRMLECALAAGADYIVTYDAKHLLQLKNFNRTQILTPRQLLRLTGAKT